MSDINPEALEALVRAAMASGVACFTDRVSQGLVSMNGPLTEAFGDYPAEFIAIRTDLIRALGGAS